ncbi:ABC transporter permease [Seonamhaeicola sp.]|uniref:ABC transporter permease n=1 Tax=Seonamhaeicola sp. TaxID=1912245 RepID=UPI00262C61FF|nr:ABC transporter permease [Seonamhaeicola sp.]
MSIWKISLQNLKSKPLYTFLSVFTLSLSIMLLLGVQQIKTSFEYQMENNLGGIDLVIGAKGSPLQLVLASVLHLDNPTGNIPYNEAKKIGKNPLIKIAVPISYGDNYKGYRIVGTTNDFRHLYNTELENGRDIEKTMEVVIGHTVAQVSELSIGDTFLSSHGLVETDIETHDEKFTVVGILKPTQKVIDRLIISNLESIWDVHEHEEETDGEENHDDHNDEHDHEHQRAHQNEEEKKITSLLVSFRNPTGFLTLPRTINERTNMQAALPKYELDKLYDFMGVGLKAINWIAYLILVISGLTIFISLYKMVKERAFDLALLRTYGATYFQVMRMVAYEGFIIVLMAFFISIVLVKIALPMLLETIEVGFKDNLLQRLPFQEIFQIGMVVFMATFLSIVIAVYPIMKMKVSEILRDEK